ncbi:hypothetical protein BGW38_003564, partial [Lunasporangiospora selenospora]
FTKHSRDPFDDESIVQKKLLRNRGENSKIPVSSLLPVESNADVSPRIGSRESVRDIRRGFYDEDLSDQHGDANDAYDDDIGPDNECDVHNLNVERSPPTKKRKGSKFTDDRSKSLQRRYSGLGEKWTLKSGTVVEEILLEAGKRMNDFHPIHSFMLDLSDKVTRQLFSKDDWTEICSKLPYIPPYSKEATDYLDKFEHVAAIHDLQDLLHKRPQQIESQLIHECLLNWLYLYETDNPSPFDVASSLSENWWLKSAWGVCTNLAKGVPGRLQLIFSILRQ